MCLTCHTVSSELTVGSVTTQLLLENLGTDAEADFFHYPQSQEHFSFGAQLDVFKHRKYFFILLQVTISVSATLCNTSHYREYTFLLCNQFQLFICDTLEFRV